MSIYYTPEQHADRRRRAVRLKEKGWKQKHIAEAMGVTDGAVSQWLSDYRTHGEAAFEPRYRASKPKCLPEALYPELRALLEEGPEAHGYADGIWTGERVAGLITTHFEVSLSVRTAYRILDALDYSSQKPQHQASERDQQEVQQWKEQRLSAIKKNSVPKT